MKTRIWIDTTTGTWGNATDLAIIELEEEDVSALANLSDLAIRTYGQEYGEPVR